VACSTCVLFTARYGSRKSPGPLVAMPSDASHDTLKSMQLVWDRPPNPSLTQAAARYRPRLLPQFLGRRFPVTVAVSLIVMRAV
jgi:hypothetical protein